MNHWTRKLRCSSLGRCYPERMEAPAAPRFLDAANEAPGRLLHVAVIGPGSCSRAEYKDAYEVGRLLVLARAAVVCGGLGGVMEAAARGAREAGGHTIGILPGHDRSSANAYVEWVVTTGLGEARNVVVVSSGDAVIAVGGSYGTLSEIGLAAKIGRPVVLLHSWKLNREEEAESLHRVSSPAEAVESVHRLLSLPYPLG